MALMSCIHAQQPWPEDCIPTAGWRDARSRCIGREGEEE